MSWKEGFHDAIARYMALPEGSKVIDLEEKTISTGYCETCWDEYEVVDVHYLTPEGEKETEREYDLSVADFLRVVTRWEEEKNAG